MKIGRYDQKISFISEGTTADNYGGTTPTETIELETYASIQQMPQSKTIEQSQLGLPARAMVRGFTTEPAQPECRPPLPASGRGGSP